MSNGTVKWFNGEKGYGFITPDDGGADLFVHFSNIAADGYRSLSDGEAVEYEAAQGKKGPEAINVRSLGGGTPRPDRPRGTSRPGGDRDRRY